MALAVAATVLVMLAAGAVALGVIVATRKDSKPAAIITTAATSPATAPTTTPTTAPAPTAPPSTVAPASTSAPTVVPVPRPATPTSGESIAASNLQYTAQSYLPSVDSFLTGTWVAQLSSKKPGTYDPQDGITYDLVTIWNKHIELSNRYGTYLLRSGDFSTYQSGGYWVDVYGQAFNSPAVANAWCDAQGFAASQCFAKLLSHTASSNGASVNR